ncbi:30S ribosome-binding factor RbfA [Limisalsivibrio acetivorans]|uniref:30S ribosome-binding factor RbfA n=1 Tax=Limisalsivibrio acetivorans TaxID=1304888 RepID=UPI0003B76DD5|nr:30S ribosome-binding factor RbfA [Limisalsivibrio acetivorans]
MHRIERVSELLKEEISRIIQFEVKDPKVRSVVVTTIDVSRDLSYAKVFFTTFEKDDKKGILRGLMRSAGFINHRLAKKIRLKKIPKLSFHIDESGEYGEYIDGIIREIKDDDSGDERDS